MAYVSCYSLVQEYRLIPDGPRTWFQLTFGCSEWQLYCFSSNWKIEIASDLVSIYLELTNGQWIRHHLTRKWPASSMPTPQIMRPKICMLKIAYSNRSQDWTGLRTSSPVQFSLVQFSRIQFLLRWICYAGKLVSAWCQQVDYKKKFSTTTMNRFYNRLRVN